MQLHLDFHDANMPSADGVYSTAQAYTERLIDNRRAGATVAAIHVLEISPLCYIYAAELFLDSLHFSEPLLALKKRSCASPEKAALTALKIINTHVSACAKAGATRRLVVLTRDWIKELREQYTHNLLRQHRLFS
ncbi:hypothetical protein EKL30_01410 [Candidimonas sp. SYP-B2681]|uniref:hypothetical protein n=1 Tax=Candidimonas sp. SYP-B2681 TaxID=2497686 RepID=UPI000F8847A9|nr:hypothetical protein [Candidimonas sp. SYP-B2681]RTZ47679.1 hypothetical protein EKL30_01410 [Candidimonas sp. SYP-B2681]